MTTTTASTLSPAEKARALWALGDYPTVAHQVIPLLGRITVEAAGVQPQHRVLDVAAGAGNAAIPAARLGARVVATDITPELLDSGRREARGQGVELDWQLADAQDLPFADDDFDVALSTVGVMFAPDHQACADELVRVVRPGGVIGLANWTPTGFIGQMLATLRPYLPPPPAGARPGTLWGDPAHVAALFGDRVCDFAAQTREVNVSCFDHPDVFRDFFKANYGPTVAAYRGLGGDPGREASLDRDLSDLAARHDIGGETGFAMSWEYLLVTAHVAESTRPRS
jgi:SAM-dependent methyltransferase